jgi:hypothetical protein
MFTSKVLDGRNKYDKSWNITSINKGAKRKKRWVSDDKWNKWCRMQNLNSEIKVETKGK